MYRILLIEDSEADASVCRDAIEMMNDESPERELQLTVSPTYEEAREALGNHFHGVIVDIKLNDGYSGNDIIHTIISNYRIPVAVMTGTPDTDLDENSPINVYKKGEKTYKDIINDLVMSFDTGLFDVIGGKGVLEDTMNQVFWKNLYPQIKSWTELKREGYDTEKILLRYAVSHIQELLDYEVPAYVTYEMYIKPPVNKNVRTGTILKSKEDSNYCIVLSPPCDLAIHNGKMKTDTIMVCEIESEEKICKEVIGSTGEAKRKKVLLPAIKNNYKEYYHWLPQNELFEGGYVNFRHTLNYSQEELDKYFEKSNVHLTNFFVKDILGRFSAYYARQGQPDFEFDVEAEKILRKYYNNQNES